METLLHNALANALVVAAAAPLVWFAGRAFKRPAITHALWLLLLFKLLTPPMWSVPVRLIPAAAVRVRPPVELPLAPSPAESLPPPIVTEPLDPPVNDQRFVQVDPSELNATKDQIATIIPQSTSETVAPDERHVVDTDSNTSVAVPSPVPTASHGFRAATISGWQIALLVWLVGSAAFAIAFTIRLIRFAKVIRQAAPASPDICFRVAKWAARVGLRNAPKTIMTHGALSPMVWGPFRPRLLLPSELWRQLGEVERDAVVLHELAHLARRDHWVRCVELLVAIVYWWFPVCWWLRFELHEAEEQCCDAWVLWAIPGGFRPYAGTILQTVDFLTLHGGPGVPALASGMGQFRHLKRRLVMLKRGDVSRALTRSGVLMVVGAAGLLLPLTPIIAQVAPPHAEASEKSADDSNNKPATIDPASKPEAPTATEAAPTSALPPPAIAGTAPVAVEPPKADPSFTPPAAPGEVAPVGVTPPKAESNNFAPATAYGKAGVIITTPDDAVVEQSREAGVQYRIVSVDASAPEAIRELEKRIADEQAKLANDMRKLESLRKQYPKLDGGVFKSNGEIVTQVLPDGRVITMRRATGYSNKATVTPVPALPGGASNGQPDMPHRGKDRDQRLADIERQLQMLLNEVDKMRYEKGDKPSPGVGDPYPTAAPTPRNESINNY